jgi:uncharacterized protein (TIGR02246 family)
MNWQSKIFIAILALATVAIGCVRTTIPENTNDQNAMKDIQGVYEKAYCQKDMRAFAALWAPGSRYENLMTGEELKGKEAIEKYFTARFRGLAHAQLEIQSDGIHCIKPHLAIEHGTILITKEDGKTEKESFRAVFVRKDGKWLLRRLAESPLRLAPSHFEYLKDLGWLCGTWLDRDEHVNIISHWRWDANKNFLIGHFSKKVLNQNELNIRQIIAWDPAEKRIRSWVFDSDGGFGEGVWTKEDGSWYVRATFCLPDGRRAAATHIYTPINDTSYTFSATSRDIDGKILPNIGPFTIVKKEGVRP